MKFVSALSDIVKLVLWAAGAIRESIFKAKLDEAAQKAKVSKDTSDLERLVNK